MDRIKFDKNRENMCIKIKASNEDITQNKIIDKFIKLKEYLMYYTKILQLPLSYNALFFFIGKLF